MGVDDCDPYKRNLGTEEDSQEKMETEIGAMLTQTKEDLGLPEAGKGRKDHPLEASEGAWPCLSRL